MNYVGRLTALTYMYKLELAVWNGKLSNISIYMQKATLELLKEQMARGFTSVVQPKIGERLK
jgi:hypothetical protein